MKATRVNENTLAMGPFACEIVSEIPEYYIAKQIGISGWSKPSACNLIFVNKETLEIARMIKSNSSMEII